MHADKPGRAGEQDFHCFASKSGVDSSTRHPYNPVMPNLRLILDWSLYRLALLLAAPLIPLRLLWRGRRERGYLQHWGERLGSVRCRTGALWIHAVSVGEMRAAQPLIAALRDAHPDAPVLLTCMTPTGRATGRIAVRRASPASSICPTTTPGWCGASCAVRSRASAS